jgi:GntR family transcriptional regulator, carbon starvation induced regulator
MVFIIKKFRFCKDLKLGIEQHILDDSGQNRKTSETQTSKVYELLRQEILWGKLGRENKLTVEALAKKFNFGRTPIREALLRLVADGLVLNEPHQGYQIPPFSMAGLEDIVAHRKMIECNALKMAIENGDEEWEVGIKTTFYRMARLEERCLAGGSETCEEWELMHRHFHEALTSGAGSFWAQKMLRTLYDQGDRYRRLYRPKTVVVPQIHDDHKKLLDATLNRNVDLALEIMDSHVGRLLEGASASGLAYLNRPSI